ncbi:hypothetical protein MNEG_1388 [Monoraphidium neglectum]|uniref:Uncharacterized protein n=1 Tax=Monoraphidium neglectum TaxID=145388 RepID=A0A0D2MVM1_9CHLO|nr:hypothetical protein MNEG_1388 [Monoraphidium neglectum]KIZ06565.1 hypothetical protein MNEG_1388 [Monoraphidium neglectum]|eukprot:XP_013905584.1 hypothetical protein MNEG_1388 [Monoraphidium neglectum]
MASAQVQSAMPVVAGTFPPRLLERNLSSNIPGCGKEGKPCCCPVADAGRTSCCENRDLACYKFDRGPEESKGLCLPIDPKPGCGKEDGTCCLAWRANRYVVSCEGGLTCIPPAEFVYRSSAQHDLLAANFAAAYTNPKVLGTCKRKPKCGVPQGPCGVEEGCADAACPKGFYCANYADATVGSRCEPLPADAGKPGGFCLPNNFPAAPVLKLSGWPETRAPPYCPGKDDVCFAFAGPLTLRTNSYLTIFNPSLAKKSGSRIWLSQCVTVPKACGGIGQPCCPGVSVGVVTDKPLPSFNTSWQGRPCDDTSTPDGAYCNGQWTALGGPMYGQCVANTKGCNDIGNKCCIRTSADKSERYCKGGGKRVYCVFTDNTCRLCPRVTETLLDFFVCT